MVDFRKNVERLLEGVTDDGWKHLDYDLITSCYHGPHEWIPLMKRIVVAAEYVRAMTWGDVPMEDEYESEEETESKEKDGESGSD